MEPGRATGGGVAGRRADGILETGTEGSTRTQERTEAEGSMPQKAELEPCATNTGGDKKEAGADDTPPGNGGTGKGKKGKGKGMKGEGKGRRGSGDGRDPETEEAPALPST